MLDLVVGIYNGTPVYLRDMARIDDAPQERAQEAYTSGELGGMIIVQKQSGSQLCRDSGFALKADKPE